ncbi:hypothetical protein CO613_04505 [Lysobacteraceae bacterium NML07-0707]|nr:hypothetical protein CO613_04505 [Xanthomonadaceae bacterium NML07-0707]
MSYFSMSKSGRLNATTLSISLALVLGCNSVKAQQGTDTPQVESSPTTALGTTRSALVEHQTPKAEDAPQAVAGLEEKDDIPPLPRSGSLTINVDSIPINVFANEVFGNLLGLTVKIDPQVVDLKELVTLNTSERLPPHELYVVARQVLADYGIAVRREGGVIRIMVSPTGSSALPPLVISGRALPDAPISHRPVFQLMDLKAARSADMRRWLTTIFGEELEINDDATRNSLLIRGKPESIRQAMSVIQVFDRPNMNGRISTRIDPAFVAADQLTQQLHDALTIQGYSVSRNPGTIASITLLPVQTSNTILIFATNQQTLDYAVQWARELDRPSPTAGDKSLFYYQVRNTRAADILTILSSYNMQSSGQVLANINNTSSSAATSNNTGAGATTGTSSQSIARNSTGTIPSVQSNSLMLDEPRNALIFQGTPAEWERMQHLIKQIDRAPRQVLIEVTIAEVSLDNELSIGVSWFAKNGFRRFDGRVSSGSTPNGKGNGLTYLLDIAGQNRMALNAFANDNRVTVRSSPRLLVKSGTEANIDIGTEVPTITMQTTSNQTTNGNSNLLQTIQYRKTGIITSIKPTVLSNNRVDLEISQEVSEVTDTGTTIGGSPSIFNRSLNTSLSLNDGGSIVIAGLISERQTRGSLGVPFVKDIPVIGNLFKTNAKKRARTELVIMIVPYIVETDESIAAISQAIIDSFNTLEIPAEAPLTPPVPLPGPVPSRPVPPATNTPTPKTTH